MADIKQAFITKALTEYNERSKRSITLLAQKLKVGITNEGIKSIAYQVAASGAGAVSKLSFKDYLRMVDMGAGRGHPLGGLKSTLVTLQASNRSGIAKVKDNTRRPKKIYSKAVYGNLTWLQNQLLYGYTQEAKDALIKELQQNGSNLS